MNLIKYHPRFSKGMFNHCVIHKDGVVRHQYYFDGIPHRLDGPSFREWINESLVRERWSANGKFHREDGPAIRIWNIKGKLILEEWMVHGKLHRKDGPAFQQWMADGILKERWYYDGQLHCDDGPAIRWFKEGKLESIQFITHGRPWKLDEFNKIPPEVLKRYIESCYHKDSDGIK